MEAHMVKQTITYSDGTETVINYRGVIENGVLIPDNSMEETKSEEVIEASVVEESAPEVVVEEAPAESVEESAQ